MDKAIHFDPEQPLEQRVASLLEALTIDEKLSLCAGQNLWETRAIARLGLKAFRMTDGPRGVAAEAEIEAVAKAVVEEAATIEKLVRSHVLQA